MREKDEQIRTRKEFTTLITVNQQALILIEKRKEPTKL